MTMSASQVLIDDGIFVTPGMFTTEEIAAINDRLDPIFQPHAADNRSYAHADQLYSSGALDLLLKPKFRDLLFEIMPDPVLYHCHAYEIAARKERSHILSERLSGFHADIDSEWTKSAPTHVSVFVYLSDVSADDGAFEFVTRKPSALLTPGSPVATMTGQRGTTFAWNRSYYHRASPNRGATRRRLFKLSIQNNRFFSRFLKRDHFVRLREMIPPGADPHYDLLLGRFQGGAAPTFSPTDATAVGSVAANRRLELSPVELVKENLRSRGRRALGKRFDDQQNVAYD